MEQDRALDDYAARQYGVFSREQVRKAGLSPKMIQTRVESGAWIRLAPSVYALASAPPTWERQMAAALLTRPGSIVAGRSAAYLHEFPGFRPSRPVIMTGLKGNTRSPLGHVIRSSRFEEVGRVRRKGFVVTDEAETVMTLARDLTEGRLEGLGIYLLARRSVAVSELGKVVELSEGVPGVPTLRRIVDYRLPDAGTTGRPTTSVTGSGTTRPSPTAMRCFASPTRCCAIAPRSVSTCCSAPVKSELLLDLLCRNVR